MVNNNRFLILPWVHIRYLASHILSRTLKLLSKDWPTLFGAEPYLAETFVDTDKYRGTCYKAANWRYLGETRGFSKVGKAFVYHGHKKAVFAYLLNKHFSSLIAECPRRYRAPKVREKVVYMQLAIPDWNPTLLDDAGLGADQMSELGRMLNDFLDPFRDCYVRSDQREDGEVFVKGLLSDLDRKSIEPIALRYGKNPRVMQGFMHDACFDDARMVEIYKNELSSRVNDPDGMLSQCPIVADVKVLRVIECRDKLPGNEVWLYIRRFMDGKLKFSLSNAPADIQRAELHRAATLRWPIEQCFEECKSFLGLGHCEARSWNAWRLYIMFILIAHLFILEVRQHFKKNGRTGTDAAPSPETDHCRLIRG